MLYFEDLGDYEDWIIKIQLFFKSKGFEKDLMLLCSKNMATFWQLLHQLIYYELVLILYIFCQKEIKQVAKLLDHLIKHLLNLPFTKYQSRSNHKSFDTCLVI